MFIYKNLKEKSLLQLNNIYNRLKIKKKKIVYNHNFSNSKPLLSCPVSLAFGIETANIFSGLPFSTCLFFAARLAMVIFRSVILRILSEKCSSMSSRDRFSVSGRILYVSIRPKRQMKV